MQPRCLSSLCSVWTACDSSKQSIRASSQPSINLYSTCTQWSTPRPDLHRSPRLNTFPFGLGDFTVKSLCQLLSVTLMHTELKKSSSFLALSLASLYLTFLWQSLYVSGASNKKKSLHLFMSLLCRTVEIYKTKKRKQEVRRGSQPSFHLSLPSTLLFISLFSSFGALREAGKQVWLRTGSLQSS